jgi:hypothetical protein
MSITKKIVGIPLEKMKGKEVTNVCIITITKVEDFDEAMPIVQIGLGSWE